ncbi:MAG: DUF2752 domain-containing protein [Verrucomicrobiota bacterium]
MNSAPPKINASGTRLPGFILAGTVAGVAVLVFFFNPATCKIYPACQFHRLTSLNCPGCGMTRAAYALLHGEFLTALHDNALFVFALAALAVRGGWFGWNQLRGRANGGFFPVKFLWPLLVVALGFTVLRNLPAGALLSP